MTDGRAIQFPVFQIIPPGNNVRARNFPKLMRPLDAGELHEILQRISIGTPRLRIIDVGKPFDFRRHLGQATKVRSAQKLAGRG